MSVGAAGDVLGLSWNANGTLAGIDGQGLSESWSDHPSAPHRPVEIELSSVDKSLTYDFAYDLSQPVDGIDWAQAPWLSVTVTEDGVEDTTKYGFDDQWRLTRAEYPPLGGADATRVEYGLRTDGVRTSETTYTSPDGLVFDQSRLRTYTYSPLDHLQVIDGVVRVNGIDQQVEPAQVDSDGWGRPRVYRVPGQPDREMEWDAEGRMLSLEVVGGDGTSRYAYNWRDQRIRREGPGEYVESLWEGDGLLSEAVTVSGDTEVRTHLRGAGMVLAAGGVRMGHDWLGSPVMLESAGGGFDTRRYDAWGRIVAGDVPVSGGVQVGYTGHAYDPESGLTYAQARYYDPEVGLFLGPDPWDGALGEPGTLSRFVYVGGESRHQDRSGWAAGGRPGSRAAGPARHGASYSQAAASAERYKPRPSDVRVAREAL